MSRNPTLQEEVIEIRRPQQLDLSFLGDLAVAAPSTFYFQPSGLAPLVKEPMADWWPDYLNDTRIRKDFFIICTELWKDPTIRHNGRLWHHDRIIVPKTLFLEIISQYHDIPSVGHCGINRTVCMLKRRYRFDHMRQRVRRYCRTCIPCQQAKARHNRPRG